MPLLDDATALYPDPAREAFGEDFLDRGLTDLDGDFVASLDQDRVQTVQPPRTGEAIELEEEDRGSHGTKVARVP